MNKNGGEYIMKFLSYFKNKHTIYNRIFNTLKTYYIGFNNLELLGKLGIIAFWGGGLLIILAYIRYYNNNNS